MSAPQTSERPDFPALVPLGASHQTSLVVSHSLTVQATVPALPPVYATPHMVMAMEIACSDLLGGFLPPDWVSVGALVNVKHLAATPEGFTVTVTARVVEVTKNLVTFEVEAHDGVDLIGKGQHSRAPIQNERFMAGVARKQAQKP
ncbi:MAG: thioesterase [Gammaproteobacteria bacterium]|nr:thioesterase [Gammaproteobacteria bacterium]